MIVTDVKCQPPCWGDPSLRFGEVNLGFCEVKQALRILHGWLVFEDAESVQQEVGFEGVFAAKGADGLAESAGDVEGHEANAGQRVSRVASADAGPTTASRSCLTKLSESLS